MTTYSVSTRGRGWPRLALCLGLSLAVNHAVAQLDLQPGLDLKIEADSYEFEPTTGKSTGTGNVTLHYGDMDLRADRVVANVESKDVLAEGNVVFSRGSFTWKGERVEGNLETREFTHGEFSASSEPWYAKGESAEHSRDGKVNIQRAQLSTCAYLLDDHPHYKLQARSVVYRPDGSYTAKHVLLKLGSVPIFYLPRLSVAPQTGPHAIVSIKPGYDSEWGPYLSLSRAWSPTSRLHTKFTVDLLSKIGVGIGNKTSYTTAQGRTDFSGYYIQDGDPPETEAGFNRRFEVVEDRYRLKLAHKSRLSKNLTLRLNVDALSDIDMLDDWFSREYRHDPQPQSHLNLFWQQPNWNLALNVRPRLNDFYTVVEQLPELRLNVPRQALGNLPIYYQGTTTAAYLNRAWRDFDKPRPAVPLPAAPLTDPQDYDAWRIDSLHMLYWPLQPLADLKLVPRAGLRLTYYSDSSATAVSKTALSQLFEVDDPDNPDSTTAITNYDDKGGSALRTMAELGVEANTKFFRTWPGVQHPRLQLDGLRHVLEPFINYTYINEPSEDRQNLYFFDSVDRLVKQNFVRVGLRQRLQTRRSDRIYTLASLDTYADFHFARHDNDDSGGDLGLEASFQPSEALKIWTRILADLGDGSVSHVEAGVQLQAHERLAVALSYISRDEHDTDTLVSMGSSLRDYFGVHAVGRQFAETDYLRLALDMVINARTDAHIVYEYDFIEGELARQLYEIVRDLHCWKGALRIEEQSGDMRIFLVFYLSAYPNVDIDLGM